MSGSAEGAVFSFILEAAGAVREANAFVKEEPLGTSNTDSVVVFITVHIPDFALEESVQEVPCFATQTLVPIFSGQEAVVLGYTAFPIGHSDEAVGTDFTVSVLIVAQAVDVVLDAGLSVPDVVAGGASDTGVILDC